MARAPPARRRRRRDDREVPRLARPERPAGARDARRACPQGAASQAGRVRGGASSSGRRARDARPARLPLTRPAPLASAALPPPLPRRAGRAATSSSPTCAAWRPRCATCTGCGRCRRRPEPPSGRLLRRARAEAEGLIVVFSRRELGLPSFVIGGLLVPLTLTALRLAQGVSFVSWWATTIAAVLGGIVVLSASWVILRGTAMASRRIRLATQRPLDALWGRSARAAALLGIRAGSSRSSRSS